MIRPFRYLLVTHIPFTRNSQGQPVVDGLWARDLVGLAKAVGPIRVTAPEIACGAKFETWGPNSQALPESPDISFRGFPPISTRRDWLGWVRIRSILREEVQRADLVHTSNFFPPYTQLAYAHDLAVRQGKKTLFVIAEDFYDMLAWEWIRPTQGLQRWRRERALGLLDSRTRKSAGSASLTMMHTPAAVDRYRLAAQESVMIRQPGHEAAQIISPLALEGRLASLETGRPLRLTVACRHATLKGLDLLVRAIALLKERGVTIHASFYGRGPETPRLLALSASLGISDRVNFPGALSAGEELDQALRDGDLFVMPHRTTDFGRAFFDAMAAGLPVLAFRTPASSATVYEGLDGFLAPLDDVQGLAERIAALDRNRSTLVAASRGARQRAVENTRAEWFRIRAEWTRSLLAEDAHAAA